MHAERMHDYMVMMGAAIAGTQSHDPERLAERAAENVLAVLAKADAMTAVDHTSDENRGARDPAPAPAAAAVHEEPEVQRGTRRGHKSGD